VNWFSSDKNIKKSPERSGDFNIVSGNKRSASQCNALSFHASADELHKYNRQRNDDCQYNGNDQRILNFFILK
jgi:hypothetical protein